MKRVGCYLKDVEVLDEDSLGVFLDFDGLEDPEKAKEWVETRKKLGTKVSIWDVIAVIAYILMANKK